MLAVKEIFATLQGEGSQAGRPAVFVRLAGCNLWNGTDRKIGTGVCAGWCDTDFVGGEKLDAVEVIERVSALVEGWHAPLVVISGGEPCLQLRKSEGELLARSVLDRFDLAIETNGTVLADVLLDPMVHVTVSPKVLRGLQGDTLEHVVVRKGTDLKVVVPQWSDADLDRMNGEFGWHFEHRFVQPLDDGTSAGLNEAIRTARRLGWRVSIQTHKLLGLP